MPWYNIIQVLAGKKLRYALTHLVPSPQQIQIYDRRVSLGASGWSTITSRGYCSPASKCMRAPETKQEENILFSPPCPRFKEGAEEIWKNRSTYWHKLLVVWFVITNKTQHALQICKSIKTLQSPHNGCKNATQFSCAQKEQGTFPSFIVLLSWFGFLLTLHRS